MNLPPEIIGILIMLTVMVWNLYHMVTCKLGSPCPMDKQIAVLIASVCFLAFILTL